MTRLTVLVLVGLVGCARSPAPAASAPPRVASSPVDLSGPVAVPPEPPAPAAPAPAEPCDDQLGAELVRVSCDGTHFVVAHAVELHPDRPVPDEPSKGVLQALGELLHDRPDILFVRIEVYVGRDPGKDAEKRRVALSEAQRRADALFQYLWRKRGISAERLEAVGYEHEPRLAPSAGRGPDSRWPVVLRIVQRARQ